MKMTNLTGMTHNWTYTILHNYSSPILLHQNFLLVINAQVHQKRHHNVHSHRLNFQIKINNEKYFKFVIQKITVIIDT